jgi:hypothetical protein
MSKYFTRLNRVLRHGSDQGAGRWSIGRVDLLLSPFIVEAAGDNYYLTTEHALADVAEAHGGGSFMPLAGHHVQHASTTWRA